MTSDIFLDVAFFMTINQLIIKFYCFFCVITQLFQFIGRIKSRYSEILSLFSFLRQRQNLL